MSCAEEGEAQVSVDRELTGENSLTSSETLERAPLSLATVQDLNSMQNEIYVSLYYRLETPSAKPDSFLT
jgi:hypothetical protein